MDDLILMRIQILEDSKEISSRVAGAVRNFLVRLENKYSFTITEDNGAMFVTHLSVALNRIEKGDNIEAIDSALLEEARGTKFWKDLPELMSELEQLANLKIPYAEWGYLALHMTVMLNKKGGEDN